MLTIDDVIERFDGSLAYSTNSKEICQYIADLLKELQERRAEPEIVECYECKHYIPVSQTSNSWGKCSIHSSPTEKQRTCQSCDYCSWAEKREEENKWVKNPLLTL